MTRGREISSDNAAGTCAAITREVPVALDKIFGTRMLVGGRHRAGRLGRDDAGGRHCGGGNGGSSRSVACPLLPGRQPETRAYTVFKEARRPSKSATSA